MPVAQLVQHFESIDYPSKVRRSSKMSFSSGRRLSLRTMFRSHARATSSSSSGARTVSSTASGCSPTFSTESFDFVSTSPTYVLPQIERGSDPFTALLEFPEQRIERSTGPARLQRALSSTSLALQSEYKVDHFEVPGLSLFEPRPHNIFGSTQSMSEPVILDGIMEVMESG